jgi:hypothetical protein
MMDRQVRGELCVTLIGNDIVNDGTLALGKCDGDKTFFEMQGNGQVKLKRDGDFCLSQRGTAAGRDDAAMQAAVTASSTASVAHGAINVLDGTTSFWASKPTDIAEPVEFTIDLGDSMSLQSLEISWEFPAKKYRVQLSADGTTWTDVYSTDANFMSKSSLSLTNQYASKVNIIMLEPHPLYGVLNGHSLYGIMSVACIARRSWSPKGRWGFLAPLCESLGLTSDDSSFLKLRPNRASVEPAGQQRCAPAPSKVVCMLLV